MIDISGLDKAEVLAALYNAAMPQGLGLLHFDAALMTKQEAVGILDGQNRRGYFDYIKGRSVKIDISREQFEERLYDRDNGGAGTAAAALMPLRTKGVAESHPLFPEENAS